MNSPHEAALARLRELSPLAAEIFFQQWGEVRGTWEIADWQERIQLTIEYWERQLSQ